MRYGPLVLSCLWLLLMSLYSYTAAAQEYSYARYDVKDGLAGSVVYHGVEDKDGFLWFGTETGLSRFDGTHFRNFTTADGLPDNEIIRLFVDSKGRVWISTFSQTPCYYYQGKIYTRKNDPLLKKLPASGHVFSVIEGPQGILMLTDTKVLYFIYPDESIKTIDRIKGHPFDISNIGLSASGNFRVLTLLSGREVMVDFSTEPSALNLQAHPFTPITTRDNYMSARLNVFKKQDSLYFFNTGQSKSIYAPAIFTGISIINDTLCSINTGDGAVFYDVKEYKPVRHVLRGKIVNFVFQDHEGNNWFLTAGSGIYRIGTFNLRNITFTDNNIDYYSAFSIEKIDSSIYIGTEKSVLYSIPAGQEPVKLKKYQLYSKTDYSRITAIACLPAHKVILGTDVGIINISKANSTLQYAGAVKSFCLYNGQLLISNHIGVAFLRADLSPPPMEGYLYLGRSTCSYAQQDTFYAGTLRGLYKIDPSKKTTFLGDQYDVLGYRISDMKGAPDGTIWIATNGRGLAGYKHGQLVYHIEKKDGLTSDICRTLFVAGQDIWVGTDKGLNRVSVAGNKLQITRFNKDDGLISDVINAIYVDKSQVYVGTPAGLTYFNVDRISLNSFCKLRMTSMQAAGQNWYYDTTGFVLPPANNAIRFDYVGISYRSAGDITYRYRMVGLNDAWQATRETFLSYPSLPSGDYELQLIATNKFGVESKMVCIPFQVEKLLWENTWFRLLVLLAAGALICTFVNARIKKVRRQNDEKIQINNRMAELEQMALKAQMNPHFIFNSLNSVQQYVIDKDLRGANKFITEFSRLIRLTLDISSKTKISIYEEISYLTTYLELEKTKFEDKFSYSLELDPALDASDWFIPPMILQPYVENSIRHGVRYRHDKLGHIKLSFHLDDQYLICQVEDNGVGRRKAGQYKSEMPIEYQSKGMTLTAKRIEMLNKTLLNPVLIHIEDLELNDMPAGTRVILQFPLSDAGSSL